MVRQIFVFIHRWAGLAMSVFLILAGLTRSLLAFRSDLERLIRPRIYAMAGPGSPRHWRALGPTHSRAAGIARIAVRIFIAVAAVAGAAGATVAEERGALEILEIGSGSSNARYDALGVRKLGELKQAQAQVTTPLKPGAREGACDGLLVSIARSNEKSCIKPGSGESFKDCADCPEMVIAPSGSFKMGSPLDEPERESGRPGSESPQHEVTIAKPFAVGRFPVTRGEWARFAKETGFRSACSVVKDGKWTEDKTVSWLSPGFEQDDSHPVVCVSWEDAQAYASWLSQRTSKSYRLLSEAEYEYAARAGTTTAFWWGASITPDEANYNASSIYAGGGASGEYRAKTVPVKTFKPNPWGLYQVHGNAWSWVEECWHDNYDGAPTDSAAWTGGRCSIHVLRGGAWFRAPKYLRAASRYWNPTGYRDYVVGFRLARTLD